MTLQGEPVTTQHPRRGGQGCHTRAGQNLTGGLPAKIPALNIIVVGQRFPPANKQKLVTVPDQHGTGAVYHTPQIASSPGSCRR